MKIRNKPGVLKSLIRHFCLLGALFTGCVQEEGIPRYIQFRSSDISQKLYLKDKEGNSPKKDLVGNLNLNNETVIRYPNPEKIEFQIRDYDLDEVPDLVLFYTAEVEKNGNKERVYSFYTLREIEGKLWLFPLNLSGPLGKEDRSLYLSTHEKKEKEKPSQTPVVQIVQVSQELEEKLSKLIEEGIRKETRKTHEGKLEKLLGEIKNSLDNLNKNPEMMLQALSNEYALAVGYTQDEEGKKRILGWYLKSYSKKIGESGKTKIYPLLYKEGTTSLGEPIEEPILRNRGINFALLFSKEFDKLIEDYNEWNAYYIPSLHLEEASPSDKNQTKETPINERIER